MCEKIYYNEVIYIYYVNYNDRILIYYLKFNYIVFATQRFLVHIQVLIIRVCTIQISIVLKQITKNEVYILVICISLPNLLGVTKTFTQSMVDVDSEISNVLGYTL